MEEDLEGERAESGDPSRKSGKKRDKDGHEAGNAKQLLRCV